MADLAYRNDNVLFRRRGTDWGAIWGGTFTFIAIWSVFGLLGIAIFASIANPGAHPLAGMSVGMGVWAVVLSIIAMYVAGRETGRLAAVTTRHDAMIHGMIMFGLSAVAALVIAVLAGMSLNGGAVNGTVSNSYVLGAVTSSGWITFFAFFLGWLAALGGASSGAIGRTVAPEVSRPAEATIHPMRPAA